SLRVEALEDRSLPSGFSITSPLALPALTSNVVRQFTPTDPCRIVSPVYSLNFGPTPDSSRGLAGIGTAVESHLTPTDPCRVASPVFYGLTVFGGGGFGGGTPDGSL